MRFLKIFLSLVTICVTLFVRGYAQDTGKLYQELSEKYITDSPVFIVLLYASDCFKCKLPLSHAVNLLKQEDHDHLYRRLILTDNYAYARSFNKDIGIGATVIYDSAVFSSVADGLKSRIVIAGCGAYTTIGSKDITEAYLIQELHDKAACTEKTHHPTVFYTFADSVISPVNFSAAVTPFGFIVYDPLLQTGIRITHQKQSAYANPSVSDSGIINTLPDRTNKDRFDKTSYSKTVKDLAKNNIPVVYINSISNYDSMIYCIFSVNRVYIDKSLADNYGVFTTNFIGVKKIAMLKDYESVLDVASYNNVYYIDSFSYQGETYPVGKWINFHPLFINDSTIQMNVNYQDNDRRSIGFGGLATVILGKNNTAKMIHIDKNAKEEITISHTVMLNGTGYFIEKHMTDESKSLGTINITRQ